MEAFKDSRFKAAGILADVYNYRLRHAVLEGKPSIMQRRGLGIPDPEERVFPLGQAVVESTDQQAGKTTSVGHGVSTKTIRIPLPTIRTLAGTFSREIVFHLKDLKKVHMALLWKAIFKGINVEEWFILYELNYKFRTKDSFTTRTLSCGIMILSNQHAQRLTKWNHHTKPLFKKLGNVHRKALQFGKHTDESFLDMILKNLNLTKEPLDSILVREERQTRLTAPAEEQRVGVGYKDHGSLGPGNREIPSEEVPLPEPVAFAAVLEEWKNLCSFWKW